MAPDLSNIHATPRRPRAATSMLPAIVSPPSAARQGPNSTSPIFHSGSPPLGASDHSITSTAQGPLRHPKPLTPSDLHMELEKEQEAMVNRLTRELSLLRQQTASVASTTSSTSTLNESADGYHHSPSLGSSNRSHSSRRQRSSSSLSAHTPAAQGPAAASVTGIAPSRETSIPARTARSREASLTSRRPSFGSMPSSSHHTYAEPISYFGTSPSIYPHRDSVSQTQLGQSHSCITRYEEAAFHKSEFETMKRENELLRKRVRELESILKKQRDGEPEGSTGMGNSDA
ncbi:hypothetical protein N7532_000459 [Penicillium argentinense]|uniref:Uncharacterized protein n=1 Tax=Penicillium argentinense TaxID=1131581 RepID=A0A9W9G5J8_9EURO|nr:uncharacterized protein N7532_000459 [Penicillium argentinense]KAJ5112414.1 hypothetical protein N7532_000459 [Penicillium argentinense]